MKKTVLLLTVLLCSLAKGQYWENPNQKPSLFGMRINRAHILGDTVGCWLFSEGFASKVYDLSGNGNIGTLTGNTAWVPGKFGSALQFDGVTDVINLGTNPKLGFTSEDFSVYIYFKITDSAGSDWIYSKGLANDDGFYIQLRADNTIRVATCQDGAQQETNTATLYLDNVWHSLVMTRLGSYIHIYLDGVECSYIDQPAITNPAASTRTAYISGYAGDYGIVGLIDHAALWNGRALSASEIALLYREPFCMFEPSWDWVLYGGISAPAVGASQIIFINN